MDKIFDTVTLAVVKAIQIGLPIILLALIASVVVLVYVDSLTHCWKYLERNRKRDDQVEITLEPNLVHDPFRGEIIQVFSLNQLPAIGYIVVFFLETIPIFNTFLLIHSVEPFFKILKKNSRNPYLKVDHIDVFQYLKNNPEVRSKLYQSFTLNFILRYIFGIKHQKMLFS